MTPPYLVGGHYSAGTVVDRCEIVEGGQVSELECLETRGGVGGNVARNVEYCWRGVDYMFVFR